MPVSPNSPFLRSLQRRDVLSDEEIGALGRLSTRMQCFRRGEELVSEGSRPLESCLLVSGLVARTQFVESGRRQICELQVPGDFVDLHALLLKSVDHSVLALTECQAAFIPHDELRQLTVAFPHLGRLLWLETMVDAAIHRATISCLGRRKAEQHLAHLICELYLRLEVAGLARENQFEFPVTQPDLADILGLSTVHVNRTLQAVRARGLLVWHGGTVVIPDFERLAKHGDFRPDYLYLRHEQR